MGDAQDAVTAAARQQVGAVWGAETAADLTLLGEGMEYRVYRAGGVAFRFAKHGRPDGHEAALLDALAPTLPARVPVPRRPAHAAFMAYDLLPGICGDQLDAEAHPELAPALGRFLRALHAFPVDVAQALGVRPTDQWQPRAYLERVRAEAKHGWQRGLPPRLAAACAGFLDGDTPLPPDAPGPGCLVHGDLEAEHVIVDEHTGALVGVIDWDDAAIADPARDFGGLLAWGGPPFLARVLRTYGAPIDVDRVLFLARCFALLDLFEDEADHAFPRRQLERVFLETS